MTGGGSMDGFRHGPTMPRHCDKCDAQYVSATDSQTAALPILVGCSLTVQYIRVTRRLLRFRRAAGQLATASAIVGPSRPACAAPRRTCAVTPSTPSGASPSSLSVSRCSGPRCRLCVEHLAYAACRHGSRLRNTPRAHGAAVRVADVPDPSSNEPSDNRATDGPGERCRSRIGRSSARSGSDCW